LGQWKLIESSEQAMLAEVSRAVKKQRFVTFLGWTPHPMNVQLKMHYLKGGEQYFGATGSVYTLTRKGYAQACPNVGKLLTNLSFTQAMENSIMPTWPTTRSAMRRRRRRGSRPTRRCWTSGWRA